MSPNLHERLFTSTRSERTVKSIAVCDSRAVAVQAINLTLRRGRVRVLDGLQLDVEQGEALAITGANGAGKTTLLRSVAGALRPHDGELRWFGDATEPSSAVRRQIGYAGHDLGLYRDLTAFENLLFSARMYGVERPADVVWNVLCESGLERTANCVIAKLSQGQSRRLAITRAIVHQPRLVLLDEPFASLDDQGRTWLEGHLQKWRRDGVTICFSTHDLDQCRGLADRIVRLERGRVMSSVSRSA